MGAPVLLLDAGTGNLRSVLHALQSLGADVTLTQDPADLKAGSRILLPGVGAFGRFMQGLRERGLDLAVLAAVARGDPLLGICVGMQALFDLGLELGEFAGLGLLPGQVVRFPDQPGLKIPHTGWNQFFPQNGCPLLASLEPGDYAYFNHSFYCAPAAPADVAALTEYGLSYASVVWRENIFGIQFHPEKSQRVGLKILENFLKV